MSTINRTYQTALRGQALHDAVDRMLVEMRSLRTDYHDLTHQWASSTRVVLTAGSAMSGTVTVQDGNPSTVTLNATMASYAEPLRASVETDISALAQRHLAPVGGQPDSAVTSSARRTVVVDLSQVQRGIETFTERLPGWADQIRAAITGTPAVAEVDPNAKPGVRAEHTPDVAEPIPLWQQKWVRWTAVGVVGLGVVYLATRER